MSWLRGSALSAVVAMVALVAACSAAKGVVEVDPNEGAPGLAPPPPPDERPPTLTPALDASSSDAATPDAPADAEADVVADSGPPTPGGTCTTPDEVFTRECGVCGHQAAICVAATHTVSEYSVCTGELPGGCVPGAVEEEACGYCGTLVKTCTDQCGWQVGPCQEPPNACPPRSLEYTNAGCQPGLFRTRDCDAACHWGNFAQACAPLDFRMAAAPTVGEVTEMTFPFRARFHAKRLTGACVSWLARLSDEDNYPFIFVTLTNPTASTLRATLWNSGPVKEPVLDTLMAVYATKPETDEELRSCLVGIGDYCPGDLPCGDNRWAGLWNVQIPPNGEVVVRIGSQLPIGDPQPVEGLVTLWVQTEALQ